jgi:hypothetical protein
MSETMTRSGLVDLINAKGGAFPVGLLTKTQPKVRKTGNPYPEISRVTRRNMFLGASYESCVNNKQERQGGERDFEAESLPWGEHRGRFLIEHKGKTYLAAYPVASGCHGEDKWITPDGVEVDFSVVEPFLPKSNEPKSGVAWRTIALENILEVSLDGRTITLVG